MKELLLRMLYCEMLGHDASFGHIHAVNMTQQSTLIEKRVGYLSVMCTLHADHELMILLINTIQKDLRSSNFMEVCAALTCVCKLINKETIPAVYNLVVDCLSHTSEAVRKKAVMALHRFFQQDPSSVSNVIDILNRTLCDTNPCVMAAALSFLHLIIKHNAVPYRVLVPSLVSILKQVVEHRLHVSYDYHRTPAPWVQMHLLRNMAILGQDKASAEEMYEVINDVLKRGDSGINIGHALTFECVRTICAIYPNSQLIQTAAIKIGDFIKSANHNLRYMGLNALSLIIQVDAKYAAEHQMVVIDCLEDADETLKRKTLNLLFRMTNHVNVGAVVDKMLTHLKRASDEFLRTDLVTKIIELAERFAPSNQWYIHTMNTVFEEAGNLCRPEASQNLLRLIAEGTGEDDAADQALRKSAVQTYAALCQKPQLGDVLTQVASWVLGEYGYLDETMDVDDVAARLCDLMDSGHHHLPQTRVMIMQALTKLVAQMGECSQQIREVAERYVQSSDVDLQTRSMQLLWLCQDMDTMQAVLPVDASCEDLELDPSLPFLEAFVEEAIANGANRYLPKEERQGLEKSKAKESTGLGSLRFDAYEAPKDPYLASIDVPAIVSAGLPSMNTQAPLPASLTSSTPVVAAPLDQGLRVNTKKRWDESGYRGEVATTTTSTTSSSLNSSSAMFPVATPASSSRVEPAGLTRASSDEPYRPRALAPVTAQQEQKQKLAQSLFGGLEAAPAAHNAPVIRTTQATTAVPAATTRPVSMSVSKAKPASKQQGPIIDNLLDFGMDDQSQQQQQQSKPVTVPPTDAMGLLGLLDAPSQPSVNKAHTRPDLDFLFDTPATQTPPMMPDTSVAASSPSSYSSHLSPEMTTSAFSSLLSPAASSTTQSAHEGGTVVASSNEIQVSMSKALVHSDLVITATIANHGGVPVRTLTVLFDASSMPAFKVTVASPSGGAVSGCRVTFPFLQAQSSVSVAATLGLTSPTLVLPLSSVRCQFQFTVGDPGRLVPLHHSLPLTIADFMRPATITEQEFGSLWPKHTQERKFTVTNPSIGDPTGFIAKLAEVARVGHVRTIRSEVIACGTDVANKHCLIHSRVASGRADLTVRTLDVKFSDAVQRVCMAGMNASL
eukprot:c9748_g2_i1.p1 GENE.c9748_g2_i1~~c9748_g2_i1.p1  ORF type:complete len:1190 (+),score=344.76 c9748_g2_i1:202-3570(+)